MGKLLIFVAGVLVCSSTVFADEPVKSVESFEADVRRCLLEHKSPAGCLGDTLSGHFSPGNEKLNELVKQIAAIFGKWLGEDKVHAVHPVKSRTLGDFYEERVYLIEDATGSIMMLELAFMNRLGKWYVHRFNVSNKKEAMETVLGISL